MIVGLSKLEAYTTHVKKRQIINVPESSPRTFFFIFELSTLDRDFYFEAKTLQLWGSSNIGTGGFLEEPA